MSECLELRFFSYLNVIFLGLFQTKGRVKLTKKKWKKCNNYCIADTWHIIYDCIFSMDIIFCIIMKLLEN